MQRATVMCLLVLSAFQVRASDGTSTPPVDEIIKKLESADRLRQQAFAGYSGSRSYRIENTKFHFKATMKVDLTVDSSGRKQFHVVEMTGPVAIKKMVFQRMLDTETKASSELATTRISSENYTFRLEEVAREAGRSFYVLEATPKSDNPLLFRGKVWVDAEECAVVRIQASPAKNPSFWVKRTQFRHDYKKYGPIWLATMNESETDVRMFGQTKVTIEYTDYRLNNSQSEPIAGN